MSPADDVTDLRTRLIYASLEDDELVRQLTHAQTGRDPRSHRAHGDVVDVREVGDVIDLDAAARLGGYYLG